ncbi:MAG TPA: methylamine utilization protein MauJ [Polyangiaceae bacterium]
MQMYRIEAIDRNIAPKRHPSLRSLKSIWNVVAPGVFEELSWIQVDRKYILSFGAHFTHECVLLSLDERISYATAHDTCRYVSYLLDSPVAPNIALKRADYEIELRGIRRLLRLRGEVFSNDVDVQKLLSEQVDMVAVLRGQYMHFLPVPPRNNHRVLAFDLPRDPHLVDALVAYQQGLLSVDPIGEILNFWRVLEATSRTPTRRRALLRNLTSTRLLPVTCSNRYDPKGFKYFNLVAKQKRFIEPYIAQLIQIHGSPENVVDFLYQHRRNPSAHGERNVLRAGSGVSLATLHYDAILVKLLARRSIEQYYHEIGST